MKKLTAIALLAVLTLTATAQNAQNVLLKREGELLSVRFTLDAKDLPLRAGKAYLIVPELFNGDHEKCRELDRKIAEKMGFETLEFQTLDGVVEAIGLPSCKLCKYCWTGKDD